MNILGRSERVWIDADSVQGGYRVTHIRRRQVLNHRIDSSEPHAILGNAEGERLKRIRDIHSWEHKTISYSFVSVSKTSVDNDQEAPGASSRARRASPSHFSMRLLKRGSTLKRETEYGYHDSGPTVRRGSIFPPVSRVWATDAASHPHPSGFCY